MKDSNKYKVYRAFTAVGWGGADSGKPDLLD